MTGLRQLVLDGSLDAELAALVWLLAEHGVPLVAAAPEPDSAETLRRAVAAEVLAMQPARDTVAGGVVVGASLEDVLRRLGGTAELADETRDLGVVVVFDDRRVQVAHYVRPVERDAAGHLQRRPPALLSAWNPASGAYDHFWWAYTDELATRAELSRADLEDELERRVRRLDGGDAAPGSPDARH